MKSIAELTTIKIQILQCYEALRVSLDALCESIRADIDLPIWMADCDPMDARRIANDGLAKLFSVAGQEPSETINCLGVIGASAKTLLLIAEVNEKKNAFKLAIEPLSKQQRMAPYPDNPSQNISTPLARVVLREMKLGSLLQRQVTRQIVSLDFVPYRIGFTTTSKSPSVVRISIDEARLRLERLGDDYSIKGQLAKLDKLDNNETLAVVIPVPQHVRQNIVYLDENENKINIQKKTCLPLFYPANPGDELPIISDKGSSTNKRKRADREIEPYPFLKAIHAHRYLEHSEKRYSISTDECIEI